MSKRAEKERAKEMRCNGCTYTEILDTLAKDGTTVSRGSLSNWLKELKLTPEQEARIKTKELEGRTKGMAAIVNKRAAKNESGTPAAGFSGQVPQV